MALVTFGLGISAREPTGGNGFGNFQAGNHYWDRLGRQRKATGDNGFANLRAENHY